MKKLVSIFLFSIFLCSCFCTVAKSDIILPPSKTLQTGDLLFQNFDSPLSNAIEKVTPSYHGLQFSHVGIYCLDKDKNPVVIEAFNGVTATPLADFMSRYRKNAPIVIGRLKPKYQNLIPEALSFAFSKIGMTYNSTFNINSTTSYYCAQLLYAAFKSANSGKPLFLLTPMTFKSKGSSNYMPVWREYFKNIDAPIPEGKLGINPDSILCSDKLDIFEYKL